MSDCLDDANVATLDPLFKTCNVENVMTIQRPNLIAIFDLNKAYSTGEIDRIV